MDVTGAADGPCVAQSLGDRLHGLDDALRGLAWSCTRAILAEGIGSQEGASPRAHVFGRKVLSRVVSQVVIDIGGVNRAALSSSIDVLKQFLAWQILTPFDNRGEAPVVETHRVVFPTLATKGKLQRRPRYLHVSISERRQAE
jgi:hypothetical protein